MNSGFKIILFSCKERLFSPAITPKKNSESIPDGKALAKVIGSKKYYFLPPPKTKPTFIAY